MRDRLKPLLLALICFLGSCGLADGGRRTDPAAEVVSEPAAEKPEPLQIGHVLGSATAAVEVVEFSDFGCGACSDFARVSLPAIRAEFVERGLVRWRFVPIRQGYLNGGDAANAAECAAAQGKFWPMHDALAEGQREWQSRLDPFPLLAGYATTIGLHPAEFAACYREERGDASLQINDMVALSLGVRGTPTFLTGGQRIFGALPKEKFARILRDELAAHRRPR